MRRPPKIIRDIPPPRSRKRHAYPFLNMEIGDSFSVPIAERMNVQVSAQYFKRNYGIHCITRTYTSTKKGSGLRVRVWRVEPPDEVQEHGESE